MFGFEQCFQANIELDYNKSESAMQISFMLPVGTCADIYSVERVVHAYAVFIAVGNDKSAAAHKLSICAMLFSMRFRGHNFV